VILGLIGCRPDTLDPDEASALEAEVRATGRIRPPGLPEILLDPASDLVFDYGPPLPGHANGLVLRALDAEGRPLLERTCYSVGGFMATPEELTASGRDPSRTDCPYPFRNAAEMLAMGQASGRTIAQMKRANEEAVSGPGLDGRLDAVWQAMDACISRGFRQEGVLPGGLRVRRRAKAIHEQLLAEQGRNQSQPHVANNWLSVYAMAVNEENAAGGPVVTSPTNGAAGIVPAVMRYYRDHCLGATEGAPRDFLLVAAAIGGLVKHNASISGAEVGCQGEVGFASAMAAAGLCAALGGSNEQVENSAEIALEHRLGLTCDPAAGLVQVPCIERNGLGAIKAGAAASLALRGDGTHFLPLDNCIETMRQTGLDMNERYKETSLGGIAVNLPAC
jgi:L-serine dehydratase